MEKLAAAGYEVVFVGSLKSGNGKSGIGSHEGWRGWCASGCYQNQSDILKEVYTFLTNNPADIVLLHIGTNDISQNYRPEAIVSAVSRILDEIYRYGKAHNRQIWVVLALIINRMNPPCIKCPQTTEYNQSIKLMAEKRIQRGDKILLVDMENGAGIDYRLSPVGDMENLIHPAQTGFEKMAKVWFDGLKKILSPSGDNLYQVFRNNHMGSIKYLEAEKEDPAPIRAAQLPAPPPLFEQISAQESIPGSGSEPELTEESKGANQRESQAGRPASQSVEIKGYAIQIAAFHDLNRAINFVEAQKKRGQQVYLSDTSAENQGGLYRVFIGHFADRAEAARVMKERKIVEFFPNGFIQKMP